MKHITNQWKKRSAIIFLVSFIICLILWTLSMSEWAATINAKPVEAHDEPDLSALMMMILPFVKVVVLTLVPALLCLAIMRIIELITNKRHSKSMMTNQTLAPALSASPITLQCIERIDETHDTVTFIFKAPAVNYISGQHIILMVNINQKIYRRAYTLSSTPSRPTTWTITVKRVQGGRISNYLVDQFQPNMLIQAMPPTGQFNLSECKTDEHYLFLSAGSGITPQMSMTRYLLDMNAQSHIQFIYFARSVDDLIFGKELERLAKHHENMTLSIVLSEQPSAGHRTGLLNNILLDELVPDLTKRAVFTCGPEPFMDILQDCLESRDFDMNYFHKESFGQSQESREGRQGTTLFTVNVPDYAASSEVNGSVTLLDVLDEMNVPIDQDCRSGICGACKCKVTKGDVQDTSKNVLTDDAINQGYVLACSTHIRSDIEVMLV
ncbi:MAG: NADH oxidoreductase Hcr [Psychromonas sp.]|jgi:NADH oxidoreductase Hcr|uniref:2Fe-2S iron-sulfur cluster-binding protein n=1 Tax=Psychromonas sp. TaxID=1884585 RepID=UPI0039E60B77